MLGQFGHRTIMSADPWSDRPCWLSRRRRATDAMLYAFDLLERQGSSAGAAAGRAQGQGCWRALDGFARRKTFVAQFDKVNVGLGQAGWGKQSASGGFHALANPFAFS